ncbi:hypothetical protein BDP27DRAFT_950475 [Rhodocollybia butyracea]|uniref:Uncharacterized protein n=1 Tax=Rhodocollybia butyracea TaxID=206335 RepID=A0A9P5UDY5_9AGAR|nr:hypothetical protein BDP27DRAFT_950475 [Rhodocollybia butyracea]
MYKGDLEVVVEFCGAWRCFGVLRRHSSVSFRNAGQATMAAPSLPRVAIGVNRHDVLADKHEGWCGRLCPHSRAALLADPRARQWYHPVYEEIHALQRSKHPLVHFVVHVCPRKHLWMVSGLCNSIQTILCLLLSYFLLWLVSSETFLVLKEGVRLFGGY